MIVMGFLWMDRGPQDVGSGSLGVDPDPQGGGLTLERRCRGLCDDRMSLLGTDRHEGHSRFPIMEGENGKGEGQPRGFGMEPCQSLGSCEWFVGCVDPTRVFRRLSWGVLGCQRDDQHCF